jgi:AcrR family transcriptional regulator
VGFIDVSVQNHRGLLTFIDAMNLANVKRSKRSGWRRPTQRRALQTVDAILDAVIRVLKRGGLKAVTTNRIAEVAGVSIGSVYQYFPDKQAIFVALHRRHVDDIDRLVTTTLVENATSSLEDLIRSMVDAVTDAHIADPELYEMMFSEVPHRAEGTKDFTVRFHGAFRLALASRADELGNDPDLDKLVFVVTHLVESLCHGAALSRPPGLSLVDAKEETVRAIVAYLRSYAHSP